MSGLEAGGAPLQGQPGESGGQGVQSTHHAGGRDGHHSPDQRTSGTGGAQELAQHPQARLPPRARAHRDQTSLQPRDAWH